MRACYLAFSIRLFCVILDYATAAFEKTSIYLTEPSFSHISCESYQKTDFYVKPMRSRSSHTIDVINPSYLSWQLMIFGYDNILGTWPSSRTSTTKAQSPFQTTRCPRCSTTCVKHVATKRMRGTEVAFLTRPFVITCHHHHETYPWRWVLPWEKSPSSSSCKLTLTGPTFCTTSKPFRSSSWFWWDDFDNNFVDNYVHILRAAVNQNRDAVHGLLVRLDFLARLDLKKITECHVDSVMVLEEAFSLNDNPGHSFDISN